jgi:hypothetical protein
MLGLRSLFLLGVPLAIIGGSIAHTKYSASKGREGLLKPSELQWTVAGKPARIEAIRSSGGDLERYDITVRSDGVTLYYTEYEIDHDMFGGGFVGGTDVDGDGEPELVMVSRAGRGGSFVVRPAKAGVEEISFTELPESAWQGVETRLNLLIPSGLPLIGVVLGFLWFILGIGFYLTYGLIILVKRLLGKGA